LRQDISYIEEGQSLTFSIEVGSMRGEVILFSTARITPSEVWIPIAVDPSLIASIAYSTLNSLNFSFKKILVIYQRKSLTWIFSLVSDSE